MSFDCANINEAPVSGRKNLREPLVGKQTQKICAKMATQTLLQSKDFITPNTKQTTESTDSAVFCVDMVERKEQRIGVRLSIAEKKALKIAARENGLSVSDYVRTSLIPKNIAA